MSRSLKTFLVVVISVILIGVTALGISRGSSPPATLDDLAVLVHREEQANYRICERQMVVRAIVNNHLREDHSEAIHLPLYDCAPNLTGGEAKPLNAAQTKAFEARVARNPSP